MEQQQQQTSNQLSPLDIYRELLKGMPEEDQLRMISNSLQEHRRATQATYEAHKAQTQESKKKWNEFIYFTASYSRVLHA